MGGCLASPPRVATPREDEGESTFFSESWSPTYCVAFQSRQGNGKRPAYYLCRDERGGGSGRSLLRLNGEGVASPLSRFYIEPSREHAGLVHIRCCYDNKYWVAEPHQNHGGRAIVVAADEAEENLSKPTCTLFRIIRVPPHSIRLLHVHLGKHACLSSSSDNDGTTRPEEDASRLSLPTGDEDEAAVAITFTVLDLSEQFVLPRYLALKGDNGMYLRARTTERHPYLQFSARDVGDKSVLNTVHTNADGTFRVRSCHVGKFWRRSPNWIWTDAGEDGDDDDTRFRAIRLSGVVFALQNLGNDYFCNRLTTEGKRSCLNAGTPTITAEARLQFEEPVVSRQICNVVFDLAEPRIYGRSVVTMSTASAVNATTSNNTAKLTMEYTDAEKRTWGSTVTLKLIGVVDAATIRAGVPVIVADGCVEVSAEFSGSYSWGSPVDKETTQKVAYEVTVPPKTKVTVASMATRAFCDVPFSYTQRDTLVDGRQVTYEMDDGLYTGVNCYDFKYVTSEENI